MDSEGLGPGRGCLQVRQEMLQEAQENDGHYISIFGTTTYQHILAALEVLNDYPVGMTKWLFAPEMMVLAANTYKRPCIIVSQEGAGTYVPSYFPPRLTGPSPKPFVVAFVDSNHWIAVGLKEDPEDMCP